VLHCKILRICIHESKIKMIWNFFIAKRFDNFSKDVKSQRTKNVTYNGLLEIDLASHS